MCFYFIPYVFDNPALYSNFKRSLFRKPSKLGTSSINFMNHKYLGMRILQ